MRRDRRVLDGDQDARKTLVVSETGTRACANFGIFLYVLHLLHVLR